MADHIVIPANEARIIEQQLLDAADMIRSAGISETGNCPKTAKRAMDTCWFVLQSIEASLKLASDVCHQRHPELPHGLEYMHVIQDKATEQILNRRRSELS